MGCFIACFGSKKERKRRNQRKNNKSPIRAQLEQKDGSPNSMQQTHFSELATSAEPLNLDLDLPVKLEEQMSLINRKKVTFDTNVKTYEPDPVCESIDLLPETGENAENLRDSLGKSNSLSNSLSRDDSITSSVGSYPPNHRYQNCRDSDDENEEFDCEDSELDEDAENYSDFEEDESEILSEKVWAESVPAASAESRAEISSVLAAIEEVDNPLLASNMTENEGKDSGFNRYARDRSGYVHSVLNPVENIAQWKAAKSKTTIPIRRQKENFTANQEESRLSFSFMSKTNDQNQEISVDASLSNWLSSSKSTPVKKSSPIDPEQSCYSQGSNSVISVEDRPILGALTMDEIKQFSAANSPRRSPSRSPDEMPIIGSVGSYWNSSGSAKGSSSVSSYKGIPNTTSKYREDKKVIWHSTPFETRLERALNSGANEA